MRLIPLSMLNAFAYCPRRYYIEFVEGDMADNAEVVGGRSDHRRIDNPATADKPRAERGGLRTRSMWLSSRRLGVAGRIDMVEHDCDSHIPVEYKRGKPPAGKPYDNDRIQLAGAVMLLEEHFGTKVSKGYLYYRKAKRRIEVPIDQALRQLTRRTVQEAQRLAGSDSRPEPLLNDPRCPRCSLLPLCLPDEVHALRRGNPPRSLFPPRSTGQVLYMNRHGARLSVRANHLIVFDPEGNRQEVPLAHVQQVVIVGYGQASTQAILACLRRAIPITYVSMSGRYQGMALGEPTPHGVLRAAFARRFRKPAFRLMVAKSLATSKIHNQRAMLLRNGPKSARLRADTDSLRDLEAQAKRASSLASLRGVEGLAGRLYFRHWPEMIKTAGWWPQEKAFRRSRRPPGDPANALLGLAYTCLVTDFIRACATTGLDPYIGLFHSVKHGRPALALDLMEPFRPIVADSTVLRLLNTGAIAPGHFRQAAQACYLNEGGRKIFFQAYEHRKAQEITHPVFRYATSYARTFTMQARLLARVVMKEVDEYPPFLVR